MATSSSGGGNGDGDRPWQSYHTVYTNAKAGMLLFSQSFLCSKNLGISQIGSLNPLDKLILYLIHVLVWIIFNSENNFLILVVKIPFLMMLTRVSQVPSGWSQEFPTLCFEMVRSLHFFLFWLLTDHFPEFLFSEFLILVSLGIFWAKSWRLYDGQWRS